jgi:hypothetical protein
MCVRKQNRQKNMEEECLDIACKFNDFEEKSARGLCSDNNEFNLLKTKRRLLYSKT